MFAIYIYLDAHTEVNFCSISSCMTHSLSVIVSECITLSFLRACRAWRTIGVSASSSRNCTSGTGSLITKVLRLSHGTFMIQFPSLLLNASVLPCGTRNLTISAYLCWHLAARSMTSQYSASQQIPILYTVSGRHYFQSFDIFYQHLALHVNHYVYARAARS